VDLDQYDVVSLSDALRGFLQDLPGPFIPDTVYSELVYTAQGTVWYTPTHNRCTDVGMVKKCTKLPIYCSFASCVHQLIA